MGVAGKNDGRLTQDARDKHWPYEHAVAAWALAEAYGCCKHLRMEIPGLREAAGKAGNWIVEEPAPGLRGVGLRL